MSAHGRPEAPNPRAQRDDRPASDDGLALRARRCAEAAHGAIDHRREMQSMPAVPPRSDAELLAEARAVQARLVDRIQRSPRSA
jgi:hypothetical protein